MKSANLFGAALLTAAILVLSGCENESNVNGPQQNAASSPAAPTAPPPEGVLGVDKIAKDPLSHRGPVTVRGIVSKVFSERRAFILIDIGEFEACGTLDCANYSIPVKVPVEEYQGELPAASDKVTVAGTIEPEGKGFRLVVQEVRRGDEVLMTRKAGADTGQEQAAPASADDRVSDARGGDRNGTVATVTLRSEGMT